MLNGTKSVTSEVRQRVLAAVKELNYYPSLVARGLATRETKQIAILVKSLQNPYYSAIHEGIQRVVAKEEYEDISIYGCGVLVETTPWCVVDSVPVTHPLGGAGLISTPTRL